ncbi:hypothetical protein AB2B38_008535 [Balneola sp. MJW-20]|uniref:hypothetical protein n=1 Tax=Gracilimonas aurantiaca TaxID=3234185 RepID=UPI003465D0E4
MEKYKKAHLWLIIPFVIAILGFMRSYFLDFFNADFRQHIHGLSAIAWYGFVIWQPYLATHKQLKKHRKYGVIGVFLAGLVVASALATIPNNIQGAMAQETPNPVAPPFFLYGVSFFDFVSIIGFGASVIIAIMKSKNLDDHALWMISTVFWAMVPAFARLTLVGYVMTTGELTNFANIAMASTPLILIAIAVLMYKFKRFHPALVAVFIGNLLVYTIKPLGESEWWIRIAQALFG